MKRVLVTGATGFIGGRVAEVLVERGVEVVALVRRWGGASRLSRLPVTMVGGDVTDLDSVRKAMSECDVVMHCAVDNRARGKAHRRSSAEGTRNVMQASLDLGVEAVVHLSSAAVHGYSPPPGTRLTEGGPLRRTGDAYCDGKISGERVALDYHARHGLPVAVLRPTVVYGPFGYYSEAPARLARQGRMVLLDGATGVCNCLYVDNLMQAMILAATRREAFGQVFHVSDERPVTWREYLEAHARVVGPGLVSLPVVSRAELGAARKALRRSAVSRLAVAPFVGALNTVRDPAVKQGVLAVPGVNGAANLAKATLGMLPAAQQSRIKDWIASTKGPAAAPSSSASAGPRPLTPSEEVMFSTFRDVTFGIDKARSLLGYAPAIDFTEGMARTAAWIRWAGI